MQLSFFTAIVAGLSVQQVEHCQVILLEFVSEVFILALRSCSVGDKIGKIVRQG